MFENNEMVNGVMSNESMETSPAVETLQSNDMDMYVKAGAVGVAAVLLGAAAYFGYKAYKKHKAKTEYTAEEAEEAEVVESKEESK